MRLDGTDLAIYGSSDSDRYTAVVCHFCGSVVKPQALQAHMNSHATDSSGDVQVALTDGKSWASSQRQDTNASASEEVSTVCLDNQLKPPMTATACMSSGLPILQHGTSPSKGTTAPPHTDSLESMDSLLQSDNLISNSAKASVPPRKGATGRGRGRQPGAKDREYDPDRHCGVPVESGKPCTRTLTCKSHALSLRRQVGGRSVPFDKLLLEHRNSRAARSQSPLRHPTEEPDPVDGEDSKIPIKLTDCSVTLNKLKREHTVSILSKAKRQHLDHESPRSVQKQKSRSDIFDVSSIASAQMAQVPPAAPTVTSVTSMEAPDISLQHISQASEQQLTVAVPLSMISVMNLSGSVPCQDDGITEMTQPPPALHPDSGLFTLSNRARRDLQRSKLHLLRRSGVKSEDQETAQESIEEFPDIDTWHSTIPRPCQINCMKLRRIGGGSILSRRFCNFRKALLANMSSTSMATTPGQSTISTSVGTVASLLSGRSGVGSSTAKHTTYLDKVNFPGERIKV
uniref:Uncharacterized protein n=1 Tax=Phlebotomus papatasi TaxID=29031 RepID=A0A1B0GM32_PHLPP